MEKLDRVVFKWPEKSYRGEKMIFVDVNDCDGHLLQANIEAKGDLNQIVDNIEAVIPVIYDAADQIKKEAEKAKEVAMTVCTDVDLSELERLVKEALKKAGVNVVVNLSWYKPDGDDP